ncbi:family 78 glycoside hydrolase catalytic domain [Botrimarina sp.]|uniref:family 78 glycoside hydrolase catalytic domain n=1 Tax=Botrimarina sp. TaxID=2795802 RepID=UPI0032F08C8A
MLPPRTLAALGYEPLFDGESLQGWGEPDGHGGVQVVDREIRLAGDRKLVLVTDRAFADFRLQLDVRWPRGGAGSGVVLCSRVEAGGVNGAREALPDRDFIGPAVRDAITPNAWNRYDITSRGGRTLVRVNGVLVSERRDETRGAGHIGLKHGGAPGEASRFRNLYLKPLPVYPARGVVDLVEQTPDSMSKISNGTILADFGRVAFGNLELTHPGDGVRRVTVRFGENLEGGRVDRRPPGTVRYAEVEADLAPNQATRVAPAPDARNTGQTAARHPPAVLTPPDWGVVTPFRWVEIEGLPSDFLLSEGAADRIVRRAAFPSDWDHRAAAFDCSDPRLNAVWRLCRYSIKATAFAGVYVDGDRERIPYEADAYLNQLSHYYAEGDVGFARRTLDWLLENPTWPTEWQPHLIFMAHADWVRTADADWLGPRYEALKAKTLASGLGPSGLVESDDEAIRRNDIVDWPPPERDGYVRSRINTVVNAFHYAAVAKMAELARAIGEEADAAAYEEHASEFREVFRRELFDPSSGLFSDGKGIDHSSSHANFFPLAFGLTPEQNRGEAARWLADRGMRCSVYGAQYLLEALFENGAGEAAVDMILAPGDRSWRHMVDSGATITWEAWDRAYKPNLDWNHAWGAAPANLLPRYVLGVEPASPGWKRVRIRPKPSGLSYAKGVVPSPHGPIEIDWQSDESFRMEIKVPEGAVADVFVPHAAGRRGVRVDGQPASATRVGETWRLHEPLSGHRVIECE